MKRSTVLAAALINLFCPAFASEEPKSFAEREFEVKKQLYGIRHPWDMVAPYGDSLPSHPGTMIDSTPFFRVDTLHLITVPTSDRDPDREFVKTQQADRFKFQPNAWRTEHTKPVHPTEPNANGQRFFNGVDTLYEKLPGGGFRDLRDGSVWDTIPGRESVGNIAPYRKQILLRIAEHWTSSDVHQQIIAVITLDKSGKLLCVELLQSSGKKQLDEQAIDAIRKTHFPALPDWYKGEQLQFKIDMSKVAALKKAQE